MTNPQQHDPRYPDGRIRFGVFFQGVNFHTIWTDENSGSQHDFESFRRVIQTAERGLFSAFFLGEGLRLREHLGRLHDLDIAGRPDAQTQLAALAAVTERIGLVATQNTTYNDPADLAYRLASLDLLSDGRAAWNIVTTDNAWTGANFRRGGYLAHEHRYERAAEFIDAAKALWRAWPDQHVDVAGRHVTFSTDRVLPPSSQGRPVLFQAGDSSEGRDFAAQHADVIFSAHPGLDDATTFAADVRARLLRFGRAENELAFFPGQVIILGDSATDAAEKADWVRHSQVTPQTALAYLEQIWGTDLSAYDPDGPLPDIDPVQDETNETRGSPFRAQKARELAASWRAISVEKKLSIREFVIHLTSSRGLIGSYSEVADQIREYTRRGVVQGFNISPYLVPSGLDDIVNGLVPELQERGIYPTEYESTTLREELGLPAVEAAGSVAALESA